MVIEFMDFLNSILLRKLKRKWKNMEDWSLKSIKRSLPLHGIGWTGKNHIKKAAANNTFSESNFEPILLGRSFHVKARAKAMNGRVYII